MVTAHPAIRRSSAAATSPLGLTFAVTALAAVGLGLPTTSVLGGDPARYAVVHLLLELLSVFLMLMIFGLAWTMRRELSVGPVPLVAAPFLAVALLHVAHALTYEGMPNVLTSSSTEKTIDFWLLGRTVAIGLFAYLALCRNRGLTPIARWRDLVIVVLGVSLAWLLVADNQGLLPRTYIAGEGLTPFKIGYEYLLMGVAGGAALVLASRSLRRRGGGRRVTQWLAFAIWCHALAEMFFALYRDPNDLLNLLGHLFKTVGDLAIFRTLFVASVREPYAQLSEAQRHLGATLRAIPDPWLVVDADARVIERCEGDAGPFGLAGRLVGARPEDLLRGSAATAFRTAVEGTLGDGETRRIVIASGVGPQWYEATSVRMNGRHGHGHQCLVMVADVTERRQGDEELRVAATAFEVPVGLVVADAQQRIVRVNQAFCELSGFPVSELVGQPLATLAANDEDAARWRDAYATATTERLWHGENRVRRRVGEPFQAKQSVAVVSDGDGVVTHFVTALQDMTVQLESERAIHRLAFYDSLTGLANRRLLREQLDRAMRECRRRGTWGALLFIDLDHFKTLNDTQGHDVGDQLLVEVGRRLAAITRGEDVVARLGGDEFVVLLRHLADDEMAAATRAREVGLKVHRALVAPFHLGEEGGRETAAAHHSSPSIGVSLFGADELGVDEVIKRADVAMYQAKDAGRSTLRFFDPELQASLVRYAQLAMELRGALERGELWLAWQPQVDVMGRLRGVEGLLRWQHPTRGMVSPVEFIPVAEETGLILPIGMWVVRQACELALRWADHPETCDVQVSVNVSARQLHEADFVAAVERLLKETGAPPDKIMLEITESTVMHDVDRIIARLRAMCQLGVRFAMDDFGTGYSSLALLKRLPLAQVKIDRAFVASLPADEDDGAIVEAIVAMASSLSLEVVAEGVETAAQTAFLAQRGCGLYQGYLFGRPMTLTALEVWIEDNDAQVRTDRTTSEYPALRRDN